MTKKSKVLTYLKENGRITQLDAINLCCALRLSAIIFDLKREGYCITTTLHPNRDGHGSHAVYEYHE